MIELFYNYYLNTIFGNENLSAYADLFERLSFILAVFSVLLFLYILLLAMKYMFMRFSYYGWRG